MIIALLKRVGIKFVYGLNMCWRYLRLLKHKTYFLYTIVTFFFFKKY